MTSHIRLFVFLFILFTGKGLFGFSFTNLPVIVIDTDNSQIRRDSRIEAFIGVIYNGEGERNSISDPFNHFSGNVMIRTRGQSTAGWPKKPYDFKIVDEEGENMNVPLLGMPRHEDWILLASYLDHTFIRTPLAKHMSRLTGRWASKSRTVEVVLNGEYQGMYILIEKIKSSNRRLGVERLEPEHIDYPEVTGGYIIEVAGQKNDLGKSRALRYPRFEVAQREQIEYITQYDDDFREVMASSNYKDEYHKWIDVGSFVDELIVQEAIRNSDAYGWSAYFHKHRNGKLNAGPVWDFDQSAGNSSYPDDGVFTGWLYNHESTSNTPFFWERLMDDPDFSYKVKKRWESLREDAYKTENLHAYIDSIAEWLDEPQEREFEKWPVLGVNFWRETSGYEYRDTYQKEVNYLKDFLAQRWAWMDNELAKIPDREEEITDAAHIENLNNVMVYPNPAERVITFNIQSNIYGEATIYIYSTVGVLVKEIHLPGINPGENQITINLKDGLNNSGLYVYKIGFSNNEEHTGRFIVN